MKSNIAFLLIFSSACIHASWNTAARHIKGDTAILVLAHLFGSLLQLPFAFGENFRLLDNLKDPAVMHVILLSIIAHSSYILLLSLAYVHGDVGLVYPLARGSAIVLVTVISEILHIGQRLTFLELCGITIVFFGMLILSYDAIKHSKNEGSNQLAVAQYSPLNTLDIDKIDKEASSVELPPANQSINRDFDSKSDNAVVNEDFTELGQTTVEIPPIHSTTYFETSTRNFTQNKLYISILFAISVGICTATYSICDAQGVNHVPAIVLSFWVNLISSAALVPYIMVYYYTETIHALAQKKLHIAIMSPAVIGAYLIILYVFAIPDINVGLVVALREISVLIGSILAVIFLKERLSAPKFVAIITIVVGMVLLKLDY